MRKLPSKINQQGAVIVFTAISLLALLGMAGLAIDLGHSYTIKTRLQNSIDAAALSAATSINNSVITNPGSLVDVSSSSSPIQKALGTFNSNVAGGSFWAVLPTNTMSAKFCVSADDMDFSTCDTAIQVSRPNNVFVRATAINANNNSSAIDLNIFIIQLLGINNKSVGASAVAGLRARLAANQPTCDLSPIFVCNNAGSTDYDCSNNPDGTPGSCFGNTVGTSYLLKTSSTCPPSDGTPDCPATPNAGAPSPFTTLSNVEAITPFDGAVNANGNNYLMQSIGPGANIVRNSMVNASSCTKDSITTQPGGESDLIAALNVIFGYTSNADIAPFSSSDQYFDNYSDFITAPFPIVPPVTYDPAMIKYKKVSGVFGPQSSYGTERRKTFAEYNAAYTAAGYSKIKTNGGKSYHRVIGVPVANCGTTLSGSTSPPILAYACFFLPESIPGTGPKSYLIGELIKQEYCGLSADDSFRLTPGHGYDIVLYDDPLSNDE